MAKYKNKPKKEVDEKILITNVQRLMDVINNRMDSGIRIPAGMPEIRQEAAKWWINLLEPRMQHEIVENNTDQYQERLVDCLTIFYKLPHADQQQIIAWSENKIMWRGDSMKFMRTRAKVDMSKIDKSKMFRMMKTIIARA